jgi:glycosyltransferase involved in cell wall biosynthesis
LQRKLDLTLAIPLYNSERTLPDLLMSITQQSVYPAEIIFIDDASTDNSKRIIEEFIINYPDLEIRLYSNQENLGIAGNYNKAASLATKRWIQILDADDCLMGEFYNVLEQHLTKEVVAIVAGVRSNVTTLTLINVLFSYFLPRELPIYLPMLGSFATRSGVVYLAELLKKNLFIDPVFDGSDLLHFFEFRLNGKCIYEPKAKVHYNVHSQAYSSKNNYNYYLETLRTKNKIPLLYWIDYLMRKKLFAFLRCQ